MLTHILQGILLNDTISHQRIRNTAVRFGVKLHIRRYTAAVLHNSSMRGPELPRKRVRNLPHAAVFIAMRIIYSLDTTPGRSIVFCRSNLQLSSVRKIDYTLNQSFTKCLTSHHRCSVHILKSTGDDFRCRSGTGIHQHYQRQFGIHRLLFRTKRIIGCHVFTFRRNHQRPFRHEYRDDFDSFLHDSAAVSTQIKHKFLHPLLLETYDSISHIPAHTFGKSGLKDISGGCIQHPGILHIRKTNTFSGNLYVLEFPCMNFLNLENNFAAGLTFHLVTALLRCQPHYTFPIDGKYLVPAAKFIFICRRVFVRLIDDDIPLYVRLVYDRAYTPVSLVQHHLKALMIFFRNKSGIWIQTSEHCIYPYGFYLVQRKRIHIRLGELLEDRCLYLSPFAETEIIRLRLTHHTDAQPGTYKYCSDFHIFYDANNNSARPASIMPKSSALSRILFSRNINAPPMNVIITELRLIMEMTDSKAPSCLTAKK